MKRIKIVIFLNFFVLSINAQSVAEGTSSVGISMPEIAILGLEPNNSSVSLELATPRQAGNLIKSVAKNNAKWLTYTSAVKSGRNRDVFVQIGQGNVPAGTVVKIRANAASGGIGSMGTPTGSVLLTTLPQLLISGIGGAFSGSGSRAGHSLNYTLEVVNVGSLDFNSSNSVSILYTLIDN